MSNKIYKTGIYARLSKRMLTGWSPTASKASGPSVWLT